MNHFTSSSGLLHELRETECSWAKSEVLKVVLVQVCKVNIPAAIRRVIVEAARNRIQWRVVFVFSGKTIPSGCGVVVSWNFKSFAKSTAQRRSIGVYCTNFAARCSVSCLLSFFIFLFFRFQYQFRHPCSKNIAFSSSFGFGNSVSFTPLEILHHTVWRTWLSQPPQIKDDYAPNSHYFA